jgi:hypothetical protein
MEVQRQNRGYITLLATLVVSIFGMAVAFSMVYRAGLSANSAEILERSFQARNFADTCAEQALLTITQNESYSGSGSVDFGIGDCEFRVTASGSESIIESGGNAGEAVRKVKVIVGTNVVEGSGTTTITSTVWTEPAEF